MMKISRYIYHNEEWNLPFDSNMNSEQTLVLVFADSHVESYETFNKIKQSFPDSMIVGCSGAGCITPLGILDMSILVTVIKFVSTELKKITLPVNYKSSFETGKSLITELIKKDHLKSVFLFGEGMDISGAELAKGINSVLSKNNLVIPISGGLAGNTKTLGETYIIDGVEKLSKSVVAIGLYGDAIQVITNTGGGWDAFGPKRRITKAKDSTVYELDGEPALEVYKKYLKNEAVNLPYSGLFFPLSIKHHGSENVVRSLVSMDEKENSLTFLGSVEQGSIVQVMYSNLLMLISGAKKAYTDCIPQHDHDQESLVIAISCVGRRMVMGQKTEDEIEAIKDLMPKKSTLSGYYSYGEFAPTQNSNCELHNQTMTLAIIQEKSL